MAVGSHRGRSPFYSVWGLFSRAHTPDTQSDSITTVEKENLTENLLGEEWEDRHRGGIFFGLFKGRRRESVPQQDADVFTIRFQSRNIDTR
jgi:hypothetical protein